MQKRSVYLKAASDIANHKQFYSCRAVDESATQGEGQFLTDLYAQTMSPRKCGFLRVDDITRAVNAYNESQEARDFRVLLLCMMAAVCNDL